MLCYKRIKVWKFSNTRKICALVALMSVLVFSCASQASTNTSTDGGVPSKFLNPYEVYAKDQYIAAVGAGDTLESARSAALSALSQQIEVSVKTTQQTEESFLMSTAKGLSGDSALVANTDVRSMGNFVGVQYGESFQHQDKNIYTIAYIHRVSAGNAYRGRIDEANKAVHALLQEGETKQGLEKFAILLRAVALSVKNDAMLSQLDGISPPMAGLARSSRKYTTALLKNQSRNVASRITFAIPVKVNLLYDMATEFNAQEIQGQIKRSIVQMLTALQFRIGTASAAHVLETEINIGKQSGRNPTLLWELTFSIKNTLGDIVLSKTQRGNAQGLDISAAKRFAISDMQKIITTLFSNYIRTALSN